jgi:hypothetical protein
MQEDGELAVLFFCHQTPRRDKQLIQFKNPGMQLFVEQAHMLQA